MLYLNPLSFLLQKMFWMFEPLLYRFVRQGLQRGRSAMLAWVYLLKWDLLDSLTGCGLGSPTLAVSRGKRNPVTVQSMRVHVSTVPTGAGVLDDSWRAAGFPSMPESWRICIWCQSPQQDWWAYQREGGQAETPSFIAFYVGCQLKCPDLGGGVFLI